MSCDEVRELLLDFQRGRLSAAADRELRLHLETCRACARARAEEDVLSEILERRPFYPASGALKRRLATLVPAATQPSPTSFAPRRRWARVASPALAAAALAIAIGVTLVELSARDGGALAALTSEAVNDHLRVLQRDGAVDVESGETHAVKPWFEGKLDFAPAVPSPVVPDMRLEGGSTGYFIDRKAAVVVYRLRRHLLTLLAFRADGLPGPAGKGVADERTPRRESQRGFEVFLWRSGELGYALVGDVDPAELSGIAAKLAAATRAPGRTSE